MMRHKVLATVNVVAVKDNKILLSRRANTGWMDGKLCLPGGHIEEGETPRAASARELKEELGLNIPIERYEFLCVFARAHGEYEKVAYEFLVRLLSEENPFNAEVDLCSEIYWVEPTNLPEDIIYEFKEVINRALLGSEKYLEIGY